METNQKLQDFVFDDFTYVTNFQTVEQAENYATQNNGELLELGFTDGADNPVPNTGGNLLKVRKTFQVALPPEYEVLYSDDPRFDEMAKTIQTNQKELENDVAPEDWLADQNVAPGDHIIIIKNGEINTVTTRERIKFLMQGKVYELGVKIPNKAKK